jgi:predicted amidohydrolase YtcJ
MLPTGIKATHAALDSLKTARPIIVRSSFGHSTLLNQRGLDVAKITAATPNPLGGEIAHDEKGRPTGILEDTAQALAAAKLPPPTTAQKLAAAEAALEAMRKQGVTSFLDAVAPPDEIAAFLAAEQQGQLTARAHFAPLILPAEGPDSDRAVARMVAIRRKFDQGALTAEPSITVRNVKLFLDGVIAGPAFTGAMLAPYWVNKGSESAPDWAPGRSSGPAVYFPPAILKTLLLKLAEAGFDPHLHADGDGAVHAALDAIEAMRVTFPTDDIRPAIAHDEIVDPADYPRFAKLNAVPVLSFQWEKPAPDTIGGLKQPMGPTRFAMLEPAGRLAAAGVRIAYGSDWPVDPLNEWFAVKVGVTRTNAPEAGPAYEGRLGDDPGLTVAAAIRAITANAAYELHEDGVTGSLETGKFADFIVIDRDPWTIPGEEIAAVKVLRTVVGGRTVYQGG